MKKFTAALLLFLLLFSDGTAFAVGDSPSIRRSASSSSRSFASSALTLPRHEESFYDAWLSDRLSVSVGFSVSALTKNHRPKDRDGGRTFVGFVNKLENERPVRFTADISYWASRHLSLGLSFANFGGRTRNYNNHRSDGCVEVWGPVLHADAVLPCLDDVLLPHLGAGVIYGVIDFEEDRWWNLGYSSQAEYDATGHTYKTKNDRYREIRVENAFGFVLQAGMAWRPMEHVQLDLTLRQTFLSCDAEFGYRRTRGYRRELPGEFDLDNFSVIFTVGYVF